MKIRERRDDDIDQLVRLAARVHEVDNYPMYVPGGDFASFLTHPTLEPREVLGPMGAAHGGAFQPTQADVATMGPNAMDANKRAAIAAAARTSTLRRLARSDTRERLAVLHG